MNIKSPINDDSSLARRIVTIRLARLHNRSDGADVAGIDRYIGLAHKELGTQSYDLPTTLMDPKIVPRLLSLNKTLEG